MDKNSLAQDTVHGFLERRNYSIRESGNKQIYSIAQHAKNTSLCCQDISELIHTSFSFSKIPSLHIINEHPDTDFIGAGVHLFNARSIYAESNKPMTVSQPSVRTQYLEGASMENGFSTSFINICSLQKNASTNDLQAHLAKWWNLFDHLGFESMEVQTQMKKGNWGKCDFEFFFARVFANGSEIGDCSYIPNIDLKGQASDVIDCGFGLERLAWKAGQDYHKACLMDAQCLDEDRLRTATLLVASGVTVSNRGCGHYLSKLVHKINKDISRVHVEKFHNMWSYYTPLQRSANASYNYIFSSLSNKKDI
jgi:hypothetical protein